MLCCDLIKTYVLLFGDAPERVKGYHKTARATFDSGREFGLLDDLHVFEFSVHKFSGAKWPNDKSSATPD